MSQVTSQNALVKDSTVQTLNGKLDNLNATLGGNANIAPVFNTATAYSKGDMVNYNGDLYVFTANHSAGAWTGSDVVQTKVSSELSSLKNGLTILINEITAVTFDENGVGTFAVPEGYTPLIACLDEAWFTAMHYNNGHFYVTAHSTTDPTVLIKSATITYYFFIYFGGWTN